MWWRSLLLVVVGALGSLGFAAWGPPHYTPAKFAAQATCEGTATVSEVSATEAQTLCSEPGLVIADARPPGRFAEGHIAGAIHLPCSSEASRAAALSQAKKILVYADSTDEARPVAQALMGRFGERVLLLQGGFAAWMQAGQACASGPCESCRAGVAHDHDAHNQSGARP